MVTYKEAGVDIDAQDEAISRIKELVKGTRTKGVLADVGSFGGLFDISRYNLKNPVFVSSSDGVGTKLKLAFRSKKYDTVGQDLVNHCVNDILVQGAMPLYFMDYIGTGKLEPGVIEEVIKGFTTACKENEMALLGGEMAEMPGIYDKGHFDLAGFIVGVVEKEKIRDGSKIKPGDKIIGLKSNGLMTNGYSLAIKVLLEKYNAEDKIEELGTTLREALMAIHPCFFNKVYPLLDKYDIRGMAHITGGGLIDNIPRVLPENCQARIYKQSWEVPKLFSLIQKTGNVPKEDMWRTFNMGIGYVIIVDEKDALEIMNQVNGMIIGKVIGGEKRVVIE